MSTVNEIECRTQINKEECVFTWLISDFSKFWIEQDAKLLSPVFNVGSDDEIQFQLQFLKIKVEYYRGSPVMSQLNLCCIKKNGFKENLRCYYKIFVVNDDKNIYETQKNSYTFSTEKMTKQVFLFDDKQMNKFTSSIDVLTFRCELSVILGGQKNLLNCKLVDPNEVLVPKFNYDWIFLDENLSDVKLRTTCGKDIPAHRVVLAAATPVFKAMFSYDMLENNSQLVYMTDVNYEAAVEMLRYIYTGSVKTQEHSLTIELLAAADKYQLEELKHKCERILGSNLSAENAIDILQVADKYSMKSLKKKAVDFVKHNINQSSNFDEVGSMILSMAQFLSK